MSPRPGEVWLGDLGLAAKTRPIVIVSRHDPEAPRALTIYVPLTGSVPETRLERKLGELPDEVLRKIRHALRFAFDIS